MPAYLRVLYAGPGATLQDRGRRGFRRFGITPAGPMDWVSFETANRALGNPPDAAAIEIGPGGIEIACEDAAVPVAFCGGGFAWTRNGQSLPSAMRIMLKPGERLAARAAAGAFTYLAVASGIAAEPILGSRATHLRGHLGGIEGRMLQAGDLLPLSAAEFSPLSDAAIAAPWLAADRSPLRVVPGPQDDYFTDEALALFFNSAFTLSHEFDRMAYRLTGPKIAHAQDFNIVSDGIALGAIQISGDGQPLVLMADHQPTGGYPKLGHVAQADIGRLAQLRPGESCRFRAIDVATARLALLARQNAIAETQRYLRPLHQQPTSSDLLRINLISGVVDVADV